MAYVHEVKSEDGETLAELFSTHHCYELPDGTQMFIPTQTAWCHECKTFVLAESLTDPGEMEAAAREYHAKRIARPLISPKLLGEMEQRAMYDDLVTNLLHQASQWRIALASRQSPARCLKCGLSNFAPLPDDGSWVTHPGDPGRGRVRSVCTSHASMANRGSLYDAEGRPCSHPLQ